jgi:hypothetical protein
MKKRVISIIFMCSASSLLASTFGEISPQASTAKKNEILKQINTDPSQAVETFREAPHKGIGMGLTEKDARDVAEAFLAGDVICSLSNHDVTKLEAAFRNRISPGQHQRHQYIRRLKEKHRECTAAGKGKGKKEKATAEPKLYKPTVHTYAPEAGRGQAELREGSRPQQATVVPGQGPQLRRVEVGEATKPGRAVLEGERQQAEFVPGTGRAPTRAEHLEAIRKGTPLKKTTTTKAAKTDPLDKAYESMKKNVEKGGTVPQPRAEEPLRPEEEWL